MTTRYDVAVVGLGAMGAATLYQLARRDIAAIGIDRHAPPHDRGSTHGETRITREAIGEGATYVPLVRRSHAIWRELEQATGKRLFVPCGGLVIGKLERAGVPSFLQATLENARRFGIAHRVLDRTQLGDDYPQFIGLDDDDLAYHEPGAGFVHPESCVETQLSEAVRLGAELRPNLEVGEVRSWDDGVIVETATGPIHADRAIVAAGAWTAGLLGAPFDRLLRVTRQTLYWFEADVPALYAPERCPVFLREHGPDARFHYGFPTPPGAEGVKIASESDDEPVTPETYLPQANASTASAFYDAQIAGRLVGITPKLLASRTCLYTSTATGDFIIDAHPAMPHVTVISACSGHGFKHSAAIGELVAEHVVGAPLPEAFRL